MNKVTDELSGEEFALKKVIIQNKSLSPLIQEEVKIWKRVNGHSNIVRFVDVQHDVQANCVFILSELCTGGTLFDLLLKYNGKLSEPQIVHILIDICKGLEHMHSLGISHRDIKVENILL